MENKTFINTDIRRVNSARQNTWCWLGKRIKEENNTEKGTYGNT